MRPPLLKLSATEADFLINVDRSKFLASDPQEHANFLTLIQALRKAGVLTIKELHEAQLGEGGGIKNYKDFSSRFAELGYYKRRKLTHYLFESGKIENAIKSLRSFNMVADPFYESFVAMTGIGDQTRARSSVLLTGTFQFWRHSNSMPGFYVKGMLQIARSDRDALVVRVHQRFKPNDDVSMNHITTQDEHYSGYAFRQPGGRCIIVISHPITHQIRFAILSETSLTGASEDSMAIFAMSGMAIGVDSARSFLSPVYVERVSSTNAYFLEQRIRDLKHSLNTYSEQQVPSRVLALLCEMKAQRF